MITRSRRRGFSLAELLIAVVVLGLLAALAFMSFRLVVQKSTDQKQATTMRSLLKETQALYLQNQSTPGYTWEDAVTQAAADLPTYIAFSDGVQAIDQTIQGYRVRTDTGSGDYSLANNDILLKTSGTSLYIGIYLNSQKGTFGTVSTVGAPSVWQAACQGSGCDAESAVTGPPAGGNYGGTLPQATGAPTLSTAIAQDSSSIALTWVSAGANVTDYTVQYRTSPSGTWTTFTHTASSALTQTVTGLTAGTAYDFQISSVNPGGSSVYSSSLTTATITTAPAIASTTSLGGAVSLTITPPTISSSVIDYTVQYRTSPSGTWTTFAHTASASTSVTVSGLAGSTAYDFRVAAVNTGGTSAYSATATQTTLASPPVISANVVDNTCGTPACVALTWSAPASYSGTLTDYTVQYRTSPSGTWTSFAHTASTATSMTVTGLSYATAYDFQVSAVTTNGSTPYSVAGTVTTLTAAPSALNGTSGASSVALTWTAPAQSSAVTDYKVQYKITSASVWSTFTHTASTTASITVTGLTGASYYDFRVAATSAAGDSAYSSTATIQAGGAPNSPSISSYNRGFTVAGAVSWVDVVVSPGATNGLSITSYYAECQSSNGGVFASASGAGSQVRVSGLTQRALYYCYGKVTNAAGQSSLGSSSTQFMAWGVPNAPSVVNIYETSSQSKTLSVNITGAGSGGQWLTYFYVGCTSNNGGPAINYSWSTNSGTLNGGANPDGAYNNLSYTWPTQYAGSQYTCTASATNPAGTSAATGSNSVTLYGYPTPYGTPYGTQYGYPGQYGTQYGYPGQYGTQYGYPGQYGSQYGGPYGSQSTR